MIYSVLANSILIAHATFVAFIVLMVPCIFLGGYLGWRWVRLLWLRILHLVGIFVVAAQSWAGVICPFTTLEMWLRSQGEHETYSGGFVEYWLQRLLYWDFQPWVFVVAYSLFTLLVVGTWYWVPPGRSGESGDSDV